MSSEKEGNISRFMAEFIGDFNITVMAFLTFIPPGLDLSFPFSIHMRSKRTIHPGSSSYRIEISLRWFRYHVRPGLSHD